MTWTCPDCGCDVDSHTVNSLRVQPAGELWYVLHCGSCGTCWKTRGQTSDRYRLAAVGRGANRDVRGHIVYDEAGNYGTCLRCGATLNDNVDQGDICYGCTESQEAEAVGTCPYCRGFLQLDEHGHVIAHDHTDDSTESLERPRGDY